MGVPLDLARAEGQHRRIELFAANWNAGASPFAWVKTADEILAKAVRKRPAISESRH